MVMEFLYGLIREFTQETGTMGRFMVLVLTYILTRDSIMVSTRMIRNKAMVAISTEMEEHILVNGLMANKMAKDI